MCAGTGTVVQGYKYTIQVQVKVHCSDTLYRYTIQLNCKGTGKVAIGKGTQYSYTVQLQVHYTDTGTGKLYRYRGTGTLYSYTAQVQV